MGHHLSDIFTPNLVSKIVGENEEYIVYWKILYFKRVSCAPDGNIKKERCISVSKERKETLTMVVCWWHYLGVCCFSLLVLYHLGLSEGCNISLHLSRDRGNTSLSSAPVWCPEYCQGTRVSIVSGVCSIIQHYIDFRLEHNTHPISIIGA